jgi:membrane fusion protein, multidrug efflux system
VVSGAQPLPTTDGSRRRRGGGEQGTRAILVVVGGAVLVAGGIVLLSAHEAGSVNRVPLSESSRPVTVVAAKESTYRDTRTYVGAVEPWVEASVGPQYISAYVASVLVRPGAVVRRNEVLATLDCANPSAESRAAQMRSQGIDAQMRAAADEASRFTQMLDGGFVAPNDVELKGAVSSSAQAQFREANERVRLASLDVGDCILRAPFDGEIGTRSFDPGAFVRPGASIVTVVDRDTVRVTVDAPEKDFAALEPSTVVSIHLLATEDDVRAPISRRAPRADPGSRTIHFEVDLPDPRRRYPVGTTSVVRVEVGKPVPAVEIPMYAATQQEGKAKIFVVEGGVAHARTLEVLGEVGGSLFFDPTVLTGGSRVVTEGRELLSDGDRVQAREDAPRDAGAGAADGGAQRGGGYGRPL